MKEMRDYLKEHYAEKIPEWLEQYKPGDRLNINYILNNSRIVYYPGCGSDGQPVKTCCQSSCAHVFLYVDCGFCRQREEIEHDLINTEIGKYNSRFKGYHIIDKIEIFEHDLTPHGWHPHVSAPNNNIGNNLKIVRPFAFMCIFERDTDFTEEHGTKRFSVIFLFADGIATYDAIFGNNNAKAPFIVVLQDHGFDTFGQGGLMEKIAQKTNVYPDII
ncbi:MAG: hypothetical protein MJ158_03160, partial [Alphaproteobacteria bacterium]|nr:hypothetical protein [Alphaproteobacteria bacterium]